jgi:hypothetical protein
LVPDLDLFLMSFALFFAEVFFLVDFFFLATPKSPF